MSSSNSFSSSHQSSSQDFCERILPAVELHAQISFRWLKAVDREEAVAEAVAAAFESYVSLRGRGKDPAQDFPSMMAHFGVLHVKDGRHVGARCSSKDVLSKKAQQKHGFKVERLASSTRTAFANVYAEVDGQEVQDAFEERLQDDTQTPVPDQAAFRIDFPVWLASLGQRDRRVVRYLALGHGTKWVARKVKISEGRVSQLRRELHQAWDRFHAIPA